ncbi:PREDICTED: receptor-type tyrosine-protein phosphatase delta-like isoform X2 [Amphimedon queenslandica]|uniref:protein-tyrosine-phosphatase n=1 Tax=Amphimedon queenslandica TaxID=400682 RepID=A0AAN0IMS4_AMPQE|nr:PREDICTED: receptor-type tyrosine-protein phosphatase delta-like isoform X2 [Amphimedon queenslandica]|eukprot:XP_011404665.2 PREDICTED: receptor-type tyrosine-protein phosphatase delta-like isoform X2 [Amphimedon queenslandica]
MPLKQQLCALLAFCCITLSIAQNDPLLTIASGPEDPPFTVGSVLTLSCSLIDPDVDDISFEWIAECPPNYECFSGNFTQNISTLSRDTVPVLTSVDTGNYSCFVTYNDGNETDETTIEVKATGVGVYEGASGITVNDGMNFIANPSGVLSLELHCIGASGSGNWTNTQGLEPTDDTLFDITEAFESTIMTVNGILTRNLEGYYTCDAEDENEVVDSIRVGLFLNEPGPPLSATLSVDQNPVLLGSTVTLECFVPDMNQLSPQLVYSWLLNGSALSLYNTSSISITLTDPEQFGNYACYVSNSFGSEMDTLFLQRAFVPTVSSQMMNYVVDENSTVTFQCTGTGVPEPDITWYRNGVPITDTRFSELTESMLDSSSLIYSVNGSLTLNNAYNTDTDTGYSCTATNTFGNASDSFGLAVNFGTRLLTAPMDQTVTEFSSISLYCTVSGYERPTISWTFSNTLLSNGTDGVIIQEMMNGNYELTSNITLTNVDRSSAGTYQCTGSNPLNDVTANALLTVNFISDITQIPTDITVIQPLQAQFNCSANAIPQPTIQWIRNGTILSSNAKYTITTTNSTSTDRSSTLTIFDSTPVDAGDYYCFVNNNVKTVNVSATLTVHVVPTIALQMTTYTVNENSTVTFQCTGTGVPEPGITWYRNGNELSTSSRITINSGSPIQDGSTLIYQVSGSLEISPVADNDSDTTYNCTASNTAGRATDQFALDVLVAPVIISPPSDTTVTHPDPFSFTCVTTGHPRPNITWYKVTEGTNGATESVMADDRTSITNTQSGDRELTSSIRVTGAIPFDAGVYTCEATNVVIAYNNSATAVINVRPNILYPSSNAVFYVNESSSISILCSATGLPSPSITWYRNTVQLTGVSDGQFNNINGRISISESLIQEFVTADGVINQTNQTLTLMANRSDTNDNYTCRADNVGQDLVTFEIFVQVPPVVVPLDGDSHRVAIEDRTTLLSFRIDDAAPPVSPSNTYWRFSPLFSNDPYASDTEDITGLSTRRGDSAYSYSNGRLNLTISGLNQTDEGRYFLIAINPAGEHYGHIDIIIHGPPYIIQRPSNATVLNGGTATFICYAVADPNHEIYWMYNSTIIANTTSNGYSSNPSKYSIVSSRTNLQSFGSLSVQDLVFDDRGDYQCIVYNNISSLSFTASLTVHVRPIVYTISNSLSLLIENSTSLHCVATGYPFVSITWKKNGQNISETTPNITMTTTPVSLSNYPVNMSILDVARLGSVGELAFVSVTRNDTANYTCVASNYLPDTNLRSYESESTSITVLERPDPPTDVIVTSYTSRTIDVSWSPGFDGNNPIKGYFLYQKDLDRDGDFILALPSTTHSYTTESGTNFRISDGIIPYTKYTFTVVACNGVDGTNCSAVDRGTPSNPVRIEPDAPDSPPFNCTALPTNSSTSISLAWSVPLQPNGLITSYSITYLPLSSTSEREYGAESNSTISTPTNGTSFIVDNLYKASLYSFSLQAFTVIGGSPIATDICTTSTIEDIPEGAPLNVGIVTDSSTSVQLSWNAPDSLVQNGRITSYRIRYSIPFQTPFNPVIVSAPSTTARIENLEKYTIYNFSVAAGTARGYGPYSDWINIRTLNDTSSVPLNLQVVGEPGRTNITIQWMIPAFPNGIITSYNVYYQPFKANSGGEDPSFNSSERSVTVQAISLSTTLLDLYPNSTYTISVTAINGAGESQRSTPISVNTPSSPPPPPSTPTIPSDAVDGRKVRIQLVRPSTINGPISHYHVVAVILRSDAVSAPSSPPDIQFPSLASLSTYSTAQDDYDGSREIGYVAAEFADALFPSDGYYIIGEETQPNDRSGSYTNGELRYGTPYTFFLRAYPFLSDVSSAGNNKKQSTSAERQYTEFTSSNYTAVVTTATNPGPAIAGSVVTVLLVIIIIVVVVIVVLFLVYRKRTGILTFGNKEPTQEMKRITSDTSIPSMPHMESNDTTLSRTSLALSEHYEGHPPISVAEFGKIVDRLHANDNYMFSQEYEDINRSSPNPSVDVCLNPMNKLRNRYANIQCYDHSRVKLTPVEDSPHDYINANFIHGYNRDNEFIATQGPLPDTIGDFWRMVWDYESPTVVMLTNLQEKMRVKCTQYWPDTVGRSERFGPISVTFIKSTSHADYCIREFEIQTQDEKTTRSIKQFHYTSWPDFGVPRHPTPLIQFIHTVRRHHKYTDKRPMIIHCSAGVGRTGTFITIDSEMQRADQERELNPYQFVRQMRENRNHMVQTEAQFVFIHDALVEILNTGKTDIGIEQLEARMAELEIEDDEGETGYSHEFSRLQSERAHFDDFYSARNDANKDKNRLHNALPYDHNRVKLTKIPGEIGSDYINASFIDGYKAKNCYIAAQAPKDNTLNDFWKMICEQQVSVIVMLANTEEKEQFVMSAQYWPYKRGEELAFGSASVTLQLTNHQEDYIHRQLRVTYTPRDTPPETRVVHHFSFTSWPRSGAPSNGSGMIDLIDQVQKRQQQTGNKPILVHCSAGIGRTGAFCALSIAIERVKVEHIVNIYNIVKHLRTQRAHMVQNLDQYVFIYRAILDYAESLNSYANFNSQATTLTVI